MEYIDTTELSSSAATVDGYLMENAAFARLPVGEYVVKIYSYSSKAEEYAYEVTFNYKAEGIEAESAFNDSVLNANVLQINTDIKGNIGHNEDLDYYKFEVLKSGKITLSFNHYYDSDYIVTLYQLYSSGELSEIEELNVDFDGTSSIDCVTEYSKEINVTPGTYYVKVKQWTGLELYGYA